MRILIADDLSAEAKAILERVPSAQVDVKVGLDPTALREIVGGYDALAVRSATKVTKEILEAASRLRVIGRAGTGVDNIDLAAASRRGVVVMNAPGGNSVSVAEHTLALLLALSIFWAYLFWSQYLTIWYGNIPDEIGFALRRAEGGWGVVVLAVIGLVFALPFVTLLHPAGRRSSRVLGTVLALQLVGFWLDCHLLIVPSLTATDAAALAVRDVAIALGLGAAFVLSVAPAIKAASSTSQGATS